MRVTPEVTIHIHNNNEKKKQSFIYRRITSTGAAEFLAASNLAVKEQRITSAITCQLNVILDRDPVFVQQFFQYIFIQIEDDIHNSV
jgi:hypothetical protein